MEKIHKKKIEEIMSGMDCPKDFLCYKLVIKNLRIIEDCGVEGYLDCLEENARECKFSLPFGDGHFCHCPLRSYVAKELMT